MGRSTQLRPNIAKIGKEQAECLELRLEGLSFRAIADRTGLPLATVHERVTVAITAEVSPLAEQLRAIECERLDLYLSRLKVRIDKGDTQAIQTALRISERRSKLLGLDMPQRIEANVSSHEVTQQDMELAELVREAKAKNAAVEAELRAEREAPPWGAT